MDEGALQCHQHPYPPTFASALPEHTTRTGASPSLLVRLRSVECKECLMLKLHRLPRERELQSPGKAEMLSLFYAFQPFRPMTDCK
eukprot:scaffold2229_cov262-Pinguiococcus_pyrenoidosus.AAC.15